MIYEWELTPFKKIMINIDGDRPFEPVVTTYIMHASNISIAFFIHINGLWNIMNSKFMNPFQGNLF